MTMQVNTGSNLIKKKSSNEILPQMILKTIRKVIKQPNRFVHTSSLNLIFDLKTTKEPRLRLYCSLCLWHYATHITPHTYHYALICPCITSTFKALNLHG